MQVRVINLESRTDRFEEIQNELPKLGIFEFERFLAYEGGAIGCDKSHQECLKGKGDLLILEDDCIFENNALEIFKKAKEQLPEDFDLLYLGANVKQKAEKYSENLYRIYGGVHTTHAMYWSAKGRKLMLETWQPGMQGTIDHWLFMEGQSKLNCYVCYPMVAFQRGSYSDVRLQYLDYREEMLQNQKTNME